MAFINTSVFCCVTKKTVLPWTIVQLKEQDHTFTDFFHEVVKPKLVLRDCRLRSAHVGPEKASLDLVDIDFQALPVINSFGRFLKYFVEGEDDEDVTVSELQGVSDGEPGQTMALTFLSPIVDPRNKKQILYNDLIAMFVAHKALLREDELHAFGKKLVRDVLWYIDGHHNVFAERAIQLPPLFQSFSKYNVPHLSKHRRRRTFNISSMQLKSFVQELCTILDLCYWERPCWKELKVSVSQLCESLAAYVEYLTQKNKRVKLNHRSPTPVREVSSNLKIKYIPSTDLDILPPLKPIDILLCSQPMYTSLSLSDYVPEDPLKKHRFINTLEESGLSVSCILLTYHPGSNIGKLLFIWKVPETTEVAELFEQSQSVIEEVKKTIPVYHTRAMKSALYYKFGRVSPGMKPAVLRLFYKELTGDQSASESSQQAEVDRRMKQIIDMEDVDVLPDLRAHNSGLPTKFDFFWKECEKFLAEDIGVAVDERRHGTITHLARAISVRDFVQQVKERCPEGTAVPSQEWARLQFWPKTPSSKASLQHTGQFKLKFMVQQRQWRNYHIDAHYAAALYRYMREYALLFKEHSVFLSIDDKHKVKVGEPNCPVAAAERGRRVPVRSDEFFSVADHDFTKFGIVPSVAFIVDIPDEITGSWYHGRVFVGLKCSIFEPSSPFRHMTEIHKLIQTDPSSSSKPVLFLYTDGGPDHRITYISVQLSLICLFLKLDLDYLCACRTAPYHSWRNPVERVMSVLNLGLQCVGMARAQMPDLYEQEVSKCNKLSEIRRIASRIEGFEAAVQDSLSPVKILLSKVFYRLQFNERCIELFASATATEISDFWGALLAVDATLREDIKYTKKTFADYPAAIEFIHHCCQVTHYAFDILKCGSSTCHMCKPVRLTEDIFKSFHHIPLPIPIEDGHYASFSALFGTQTSEKHRPSFTSNTSKKNTLPFYASVQHVKNADTTIQCDECGMWRLVYSKYKLKRDQRLRLQQILEAHSYTCGSRLSHLQLSSEFELVEVRDHSCNDPIEKLYYSSKFDPICVYCGNDQPYTSSDSYPQCEDCSDKPVFKK